MEELNNYAELIARGTPDLIEIKGVTYCGSTGASNLTMKNVPFHEEVAEFSRQLAAMKQLEGKYELACEHQHSCSFLIANKQKFFKKGKWYTWIDYEKFHELVQSGKNFSSEDYMAETPEWAVVGNEAKGFDPEESRHSRKKKDENSGEEYANQGC